MTGTRNPGRQMLLVGTALMAMLHAAAPARAQSAAARTQDDAAATPAETPLSQTEAAPAEARDEDEIVVTGSSIRGVPPTGSNLISVTREDIRTVGANTTADLLASVPQLNSFNSAPRAANGGAGAFAPGLRSLPASATLPLMNGHRLVAGGTNQTNPDFPFLPDLAIERVEIVADGASAIYGSDAVAGVVNFITRKRADGVEASVRYGMADDYTSVSASALVGHDWESGAIVAAYQYAGNDNILGADRRYRVVDFRPYGGVDSRTTVCPAANVLVNTTAYAVSYATPALAPNTRNSCDNGAVTDLVPESRLHSAYLTAHQDLSDRVTLWGEILYSDRKDIVQVPPPAGAGASGGVILYNLPGFANPFFRTPPGTGATNEFVQFRTDNLYGADHIDNRFRVRAGNSSAGIDARLTGDLRLTVYGTVDWARNDAYLPAINPAALDAAALGTTPATALDPFGNGTAPAVAAAITDYAGDLTIHQRTWLGAGRIDGPLADLPGGPLKIAVGAEYRHEAFRQRGIYGGNPVPESLDRNIKSAYGELFVPIFGTGNQVPLMRRLVLSLSGRYDDYSDFGSTFNPKVGLNWDPLGGLTLRGTYGTSFRAPGLRDVGATVGAYYFNAAAIAGSTYRDPTRGAAQVDTIFLLGGNRGLQPEKARTWSFGADLQPAGVPGLRASVTFYDIHYTDVIGTPGGSIAFTDPTFASVVFRNPDAAQLSSLLSIAVPVNFVPGALPVIGNLLDFRQGNFGVRDTNGLDFDVNYRRATGFGTVFAGLAGNYILKFETQLSSTAPVSDQLSLGVPKMTLRGTLGAQAGPLSAVGFVNYRHGVTGLYATPTGTAGYSAGAYTTIDLRVSVKLPDSGLAKGTELAMQINDLLDQTPPFFPATDGIGGAYNPVGRYVALNLRKSF
ncbi:TonB-dependent receptor [Sphingomonas sp. DG1-23]|uniref:TonB-dependent receptor plug domain-containing protein n=1 Tax=Sphingomonas sp. DG1-23 TaxID=3068316 RepID=UPI00273DD84C|nr:TonB-dependent receptor [Sphingomonas sp. DG1-23]MDP5279524.1 TonB-dependent receptor [Sphingomonas sp. DG1-23]